MKIDGTNLSMIRGDSECITITLYNSEGDVVKFEEGDTVYFTVKENLQTNVKIIQKVIKEFRDGKAIIELDPDDTKNLPFSKPYIYDVQLTSKDGKVTTIIPPSRFTLKGDVTNE